MVRFQQGNDHAVRCRQTVKIVTAAMRMAPTTMVARIPAAVASAPRRVRLLLCATEDGAVQAW